MYIGEIGKRVTVKATYVKSIEYTDYKFSYYGTTHRTHIFRDEDGNTVVWKTTNVVLAPHPAPRYDGEEICPPIGSIVELTGTVKAHDTYKDQPQTVVTRCKFKLVELAKTDEEIQADKAAEQLASLKSGDNVMRMDYSRFKAHYSDCETVAGSFDRNEHTGESTIEVIVREGRMKPSGVRGQHFFHFHFVNADGTKHSVLKAVCEKNARKRLDSSDSWKCVEVQ